MSKAKEARRKAAQRQSLTADEWNAKHEVGTKVTYFPIKGEYDNGEETKTLTPAWALGHGAVVVSVEGRTGGVSIDHIHVAKHQ